MKSVRTLMIIAFVLLALIAVRQVVAVDVAPRIVGNGTTDSVYVTFSVVDTSHYPVVTAPDSVNVLKCNPSGSHVDSVLIDSPRLLQIKPGCYRAAFRGADGSFTLGTYTIYIMAYVGGAWRGAEGVAYEVI